MDRRFLGLEPSEICPEKDNPSGSDKSPPSSSDERLFNAEKVIRNLLERAGFDEDLQGKLEQIMDASPEELLNIADDLLSRVPVADRLSQGEETNPRNQALTELASLLREIAGDELDENN